MPQVAKTDDRVRSLVDVDGPHVSSVPAGFDAQAVQTETQASRLEREDERRRRADDHDDAAAAREHAAAAREHAAAAEPDPKKEEDRAAGFARDKAANPIVLGNALTVGVLGSALGWAAYRRWARDELSWAVVGSWAGAVGLFALGDYYLSKCGVRARDAVPGLTPPGTCSRNSQRRSSRRRCTRGARAVDMGP